MIPELLRNFNNWVCWKLEERDGKLTKVPKHPVLGKNAKSDDPSTWTSYEIAEQNRHFFDGIGFMLQPEKINLIGVDIDHCVNGSLSPFATEITTVLDSYTEITPSGVGLRIFALGKLPPKGRKKTELGFEVYDSGRFLSVTGQHLDNTPLTIEQRSAEIIAIHQKIFGDQPEETKAPAIVQPVSLGDIELLSVILQSKQAPKFAKLWAGKWTGDYPSPSEADLALCGILAFFTGNDETRIDSLFRQSGLMRDKWDELRNANETYGQITINKFYSTEVYQPASNISITDIILNAPEQPETIEERIASWADLDSQLGPIVWDWPGWIARGFQILVASVPVKERAISFCI
jgi:putative DNA primase/helicase